jgi:hypothetical protein
MKVGGTGTNFMEVNGNDVSYGDRMKKIKNRAEESANKICPFMSTPDVEVLCSGKCKLFRPEKRGYECYFMEMQAISWFLNPRRKY